MLVCLGAAQVFAYGQTGSGKTYTMGSAFAPGGAPRGVIPRVMDAIFERVAASTHTDFTVRVGFVEIHRVRLAGQGRVGGAALAAVVHRRYGGLGYCMPFCQADHWASWMEGVQLAGLRGCPLVPSVQHLPHPMCTHGCRRRSRTCWSRIHGIPRSTSGRSATASAWQAPPSARCAAAFCLPRHAALMVRELHGAR